MSKKYWQKLTGILCLFFVSFSLSLIIYSSLKEELFYSGLEKDYNNNSLNSEQCKGILKNTLTDFNDRKERNRYEDVKLTCDGCYYLVFTEKYMLNNRSNSLLLKLPIILGRIHALMRLNQILIGTPWYAKGDLSKYDFYLDEWKKKGEKEEGNWWIRFEESQEFQNFIADTMINKKNKDGENIDQLYMKIMNEKVSSDPSILGIILYEEAIKLEMEVAKEAYKNYKEHINNRDYISSLVDSNIIVLLSEDIIMVRNDSIKSHILYSPKYLPQLYFIESRILYDTIYFSLLVITLTFVSYLVAVILRKKIQKLR